MLKCVTISILRSSTLLTRILCCGVYVDTDDDAEGLGGGDDAFDLI